MRLVLAAAVCASLCAQTVPNVKPDDKASIEGTVVSATTGEPLKKTHITLHPLGQQNGIPYGTVSDNAGHFLLDGLDPGRYAMGAARNGFVGLAKPTILVLGNAQAMKDVTVKLTPQAVITGHVVDQDGEPLPRVQIQCMTYRYDRGRRRLVNANGANTNDLGEYRLFGLNPGKYVISARYQPPQSMGPGERAVGSAQAIQAVEEAYPTVYYPNSTRADGASLVDVAAGAQMHGVDITLVHVRTVHVTGRVNASLKAQQRRMLALMLIPRDNGMFTPRTVARVTDPKGNFELRGVPPGSYYLIGSYMEDGLRYAARTPVDVGNSNVEGVEVSFQPPSQIKGHVVVEANGDLKGAALNLNLRPKDDEPGIGGAGAQVKDDLTFTIPNVGPDAYDVNIFGLPDGFYLKSIRMGEQDVTETGVDFSAGVPAAEMTIVLNPNAGKIEGTVQNANSENAANATVTLIPDAAHRGVAWLYKTASTDQSGHFVISGIRPGDYKIYAWEDIENGAQEDPDYVKPHESAGQAVSIKEGDRQNVQLKLISRADQ